MAPLAVERVLPPRSRLTHPLPRLQSATVAKRLARLRILVYLLLGASAIFGLAVLLWKLGHLVRLFTLGRILRAHKPVDTRFIKTWYGWIPQDRYNSRRRLWKNLRSGFRSWFSWKDCNDYERIWWDSHSVRQEENRRAFGSGGGGGCANGGRKHINPIRCHPYLLKRPSTISPEDVKPNRCAITPACATRYPCMIPEVANDQFAQHRTFAYLTFPFCLKYTVTEYDRLRYFDKNITSQRISTGLASMSKEVRPRSQIQITKMSIQPTSYERRLYRLQKWNARLQMGNLQSILPHHSGLLGRPGSPVSDLYSSSSSEQNDLPQEYEKSSEAPKSLITDFDPHQKSTNFQPVVMSLPDHNFIRSKSARKSPGNIDVTRKPKALGHHWTTISVQMHFLDSVDRSLEWLLYECHPGNRGFQFATMPNKLRWVIHTNPCCASTKAMRQYGNPQNVISSGADETRRRCSVTTGRRKTRSASIESWRAAINNIRREMQMTGVRSVDLLESSAEDELFDRVIKPADWMLRRPPQGNGIPTSQKNAYYYGGGEQWARLEDWQDISRCYDSSKDMRRSLSLSLLSPSKISGSQFRQSSVEVVCS